MKDLIATTELTPIEILLKMDSEGYVTAKNLYEFLGLDKSNYSKWCRTNILDNAFAEKDLDYKLKVSFAKKLAMQSKTVKGEQARCYFIACEETLKRTAIERQKWEIERAKGVVIRHVLTDTIKMKVPESPHKKFIFGKSMKELREQYGVKGKESIRDYITADELREVESLEMLVSSLINLGMGYDEIKAFIETKYTALLAG